MLLAFLLFLSLSESLKASEKFETFKKLSQQFMVLSQDIEAFDDECTKEQYQVILLKYDNLIQDCMFEEIPNRYKMQVANCFTKAERCIPIQLNGIIGNTFACGIFYLKHFLQFQGPLWYFV